jgi:hypothetical protein
MKRITVFETSDGNKFHSAKEAKAHESSITLDGLLASWFADGATVTLEKLRDDMTESGWTLINLLSAIARQAPVADETTDAAGVVHEHQTEQQAAA